MEYTTINTNSMPPAQEITTKTLEQKVDEQSQKIDAMYVSIEKMRKAASVTLWITLALIVLPMIGLLFIGPSFIETYTSGAQLSD